MAFVRSIMRRGTRRNQVYRSFSALDLPVTIDETFDRETGKLRSLTCVTLYGEQLIEGGLAEATMTVESGGCLSLEWLGQCARRATAWAGAGRVRSQIPRCSKYQTLAVDTDALVPAFGVVENRVLWPAAVETMGIDCAALKRASVALRGSPGFSARGCALPPRYHRSSILPTCSIEQSKIPGTWFAGQKQALA